MLMHKQAFGFLAFAMVLLGVRGTFAADAPNENKMGPVERFVGEWTSDGKWLSGEELHARMVCEWGVGKKVIRTKTFVKTGTEEYQRYESIIAWHPDKKCLVEYSFAFDGGLSEIVIEMANADTLNLGFTPYHADKPGNVRQTMEFKGNDQFVWKVLLKTDKGWEQIIESTWVKKAK